MQTDPILYIEDGPDDILFMQRAFRKIAPQVDLRVIMSGQEAADFFTTLRDEEDSIPALALVILDLNLPGQSGLEVLTRIRTESRYQRVPVVIFSASSQQQDIDSCYAAGCNAYVVKPSDPAKLKSLVATMNDFWLAENRYSKALGGVAIISADGLKLV